MENIIDKIKGTIYGQAIGDALGLATEGMAEEEISQKYPNGITHYSDIFQDRHRRRWKIGDWTDDTDMMLCIANAVIKIKASISQPLLKILKIGPWGNLWVLVRRPTRF